MGHRLIVLRFAAMVNSVVAVSRIAASGVAK